MTNRRFLWLGLGLALLLVANARWILPLATWFFAIGWLVFFDRSRRLSGLTIGFVVYVLLYFVIWWGIIPAPGVLYYLIAATYAAAYFLPFLAHRLLATDDPAFRATLVFPLAWVSVELLFSRFVTPYGSWASLAYTQSDSLTLIQLASLTGTAGITFLITWFASIVAWMLRPGLETGRRVRAAGAFAITILAVIVFGQLRLAGGDTGGSVRTASLVPSRPLLDDLERSLGPVRGGAELSESDMRAIQAAATRLNNDLLKRTRREAQAGAKLIAWSETAGRVLASEEEKLLAYASRLAAEEGIVLMLALGVWHPDGAPPFENKVVAIDATGAVAWEYHKANPIVGGESSVIAAGGNLLKSLDQEFGRVGAVICHDLDFQPLLRQASAEQIGLVVGPSDDWIEVASLHGRMAVYRAVENGFTLLRPTNGGRSMAVDTRGRVIAQVDFPDDVMVAHVSAQRSRTLYGSVGDLFSWLCLVGLALYVITRRTVAAR